MRAARGVGESGKGGRAPDVPVPAWREVLDFLLPARCLGCENRLEGTGAAPLVCARCLSRLRPAPWPRCGRCHYPTGTGRVGGHCLACAPWPTALERARSAVVLEDPGARLVHALKYEGWRELAPLLAERMEPLLELGALAGRPLLVPVPTTAARRRERGYNQAALIAHALAARTGLECVEPLERRGGGGSQVSLHPSERRHNVQKAFQVAPARGAALAGAHILLVDDVLTTGATASAACLALERGGALGVSLITFARALPGHQRSGNEPG